MAERESPPRNSFAHLEAHDEQLVRLGVSVASARRRRQWKRRCSAAGVHVFDRVARLNILVDDVPVPASLHAGAPRHVSIALTNRCDLACAHCDAPKSRDELRFNTAAGLLGELDEQRTSRLFDRGACGH